MRSGASHLVALAVLALPVGCATIIGLDASDKTVDASTSTTGGAGGTTTTTQTGGAGGTTTTSAATGGTGGTTTTTTTSSAPLADGTACSATAQCSSGFCVDGVCCNTACAASCHACTAALTGGSDGTCAAVTDGTTDPRSVCAVTAQSSCGTDGACSAGACRDWPATTACGPTSCANGSQSAASMCDGFGACTASTLPPTSCAPYACGATACKTTCGTDADCAGGNFCWVGACGTIKMVSANSETNSACALTTGGAVQCWGADLYGQLGDNSTMNSAVPVPVTGLSSGVAAVATVGSSACALTTGGAVRCWGFNSHGQLGNNTTTDSAVPVPVAGLSSGVTAIGGGAGHACAVTTGGGVSCWGLNNHGQIGNNSTTDALVPTAVTGLSSTVVAVVAGASHTCGVTNAEGVVCWGGNSSGQLGNNSTTDSLVPVTTLNPGSGVVALAAGGQHNCALTASGTVLCWGNNSGGQLGNNSTTNSLVPTAVPGLSGIKAIAAGANHTCALTAAGAVQCWGSNGYGQLGNNSTVASYVPTAVSTLSSGVASIGSGALNSYAVTTAGSVLGWGFNQYGSLGNSSMQQSLVPVSVTEP